VHGLAISRDGRLIATGAEDSTAAVWDLSSGELVHRLVGHTDEVNAVAFSPEGRRLATASYDGTARVWDLARERTLVTLSGHLNRVSAVAFSPDGGSVATAGWDRTVRIWDAGSGKERLSLAGHRYVLGALAFSPDGSRLASASGDSTARIWSVTASPSEVIGLPGDRDFTSVAYSPADSILAAASGNLVILWTSRFRRHWTSPSYRGTVERVAFSADGRRLAAAGTQVLLWDMTIGGQPLDLSDRTGPARSVALNADGSRVATAGVDSVVRVWDAESGDSVFAGRAPTRLYGVALTADGLRVAGVGEDGSGTIWDVASGQAVHLLGHRNRIRDVAFRPDGRWLVTGSDDQTARVWDAASGVLLRTLDNHEGAVVSVTFDSSGDRIATGSNDASIKLWDAATGDELLTLPGRSQTAVHSVAFAPGGDRLAAATEDSTVRVYALDPRELMTIARRRLTRALTERECRRFLRVSPCPVTARVMERMVKADMQARAGALDSAAAGYAEANRLQPDLEIEPDREARAQRVERLVTEGLALLAAHRAEEARETFKRAQVLDNALAVEEVPGLLARAQPLAERGKIMDALVIYRVAGSLDPDMRVSAEEWNNLCWYGTIWGFADTMLSTACATAVDQDSTNSEAIRDSRGLARAVTGDFSGAIEDFTTFVESTPDSAWKAERQGWIDSLKAGHNPFTKERLLELLNE
jgi:WD40 repeat protein